MSKKLKGYKLKDEKYLYVAKKLAGLKHDEETWSTGKVVIEPYTQRYETFKNFDLLDIWFEAIYEDDIKYKEGDAIVILDDTVYLKKGSVCWIRIVVLNVVKPYVRCVYDTNEEGLGFIAHVSNIRKATKSEVNLALLAKAEQYYPKNTVFVQQQSLANNVTISNGTFDIDEDGIRTNGYYIYYQGKWSDIDLEKTSILRNAITKYPIGTKFKPCHVNNRKNEYCIVTNTNFSFMENGLVALTDENKNWGQNTKYGNTDLNRVVYHKGHWSKIVSDPPNVIIRGYTVEFYDEYVKIGCEEIPIDFIKRLYTLYVKHNIAIPFPNELFKILMYYSNPIKTI